MHNWYINLIFMPDYLIRFINFINICLIIYLIYNWEIQKIYLANKIASLLVFKVQNCYKVNLIVQCYKRVNNLICRKIIKTLCFNLFYLTLISQSVDLIDFFNFLINGIYKRKLKRSEPYQGFPGKTFLRSVSSSVVFHTGRTFIVIRRLSKRKSIKKNKVVVSCNLKDVEIILWLF